MTDGVPGQDPQPVVRDNRDTWADLLHNVASALYRPILYLLVPALAMHRDKSVSERLWRWRYIYLLQLLATVAMSAPQLANGNLWAILLAPLMHLVAGVLVVVGVAVALPMISVPASAQPPLYVLAVAVVAVVLGAVVLTRSAWQNRGPERISLDTAPGEYAIPMTDVWDSGGKND